MAADGRAPEPGRTTGADPTRPTPTNQNQPNLPAKSRDADPDLVAVGAVPAVPRTEAQPRAQETVRAFLLTRPGARPVLVLIKPGEQLFVTGLSACASALPGCAAPVPETDAPDVY